MARYGIATMVLARTSLVPALRRIATSGFSQVEILAQTPHLWPPDHDPFPIRALLDELKLTARVGHGIFSQDEPNCGDLDEQRRQWSVAHIATCFQPLVAIGAEFVVLHPTGYASTYNAENRQLVLEQVRRSMDELAVLGFEAGIKLAWENLPHHGIARPLHDMAELRALIEPMPAHVGLCLDTTHALISGHDPLAQLNIAYDRLFCLHLHDSDGQADRHWIPGRGIIDWDPFIGRLDDLAFTGTRTIEVGAADQAEQEVLEAARAVARRWEGQLEP